jgi:hypothetical protein
MAAALEAFLYDWKRSATQRLRVRHDDDMGAISACAAVVAATKSLEATKAHVDDDCSIVISIIPDAARAHDTRWHVPNTTDGRVTRIQESHGGRYQGNILSCPAGTVTGIRDEDCVNRPPSTPQSRWDEFGGKSPDRRLCRPGRSTGLPLSTFREDTSSVGRQSRCRREINLSTPLKYVQDLGRNKKKNRHSAGGFPMTLRDLPYRPSSSSSSSPPLMLMPPFYQDDQLS